MGEAGYGVPAAGLLSVVLAGCLAPPVHAVEVSTSYDPDIRFAEEDDRRTAREMGLEAGDPANRSDASIAVILTPSPQGGDAIPVDGDPYDNVSQGARLESAGRYRIPLDDAGRARFEVQTEDPLRLKIRTGGSFAGQNCSNAQYYGSTAFIPAYAEDEGPPGTEGYLPPVEEGVTVDVPFYIACVEQE